MRMLIAIWLITSVISAGGANAYFRGEFPSLYSSEHFARTRCGSNFMLGLAGPLSLVVVTFVSGFFYYGVSFSCSALKR